MADRARRVRRQVSDDVSESSEDSSHDSVEEEYDPRRTDAMRRGTRETKPTFPSGKFKRGASVTSSNTSIAGSRSLKLKITAPPSKLREVVRASEADSLRDTLGGGQVIDGPRRRRAALPARASVRAAIGRAKYREFGESDIEDEDEAEGEDEGDDDDDDEEEEEEEDEDEEEELNDFDKIGAEPEGGTDEEDEDMEMPDAPLVPKPVKVTLKPPTKSPKGSKPILKVTPADVGPIKSVEDQEMQDDPGDEEVDDSSDLSGDEEDDDEPTALNEDGADGEEEELEEDAAGEDEDLDDEDDLDDSDDSEGTPASGAATPELGKMTKRQRGQDGDGLMALDMAPQQRKFFTDAEKAMKKDEHARKRKELTKRKIQEEKTAALNRLLKPQAGKSRGAAPKPETLANLERQNGDTTSFDEEEEFERANPLYTRWISDARGVRLGVPDEWKGKHVGEVLYANPYSGPKLPPSNGRLIQELD